MSDILFQDIIDNLLKLKEILNILDKEKMSEDIKSIDRIIKEINKYNSVSIKNTKEAQKNRSLKEKKSKSTSFKDAIALLTNEKIDDIKGVKLNYNNFKNDVDVMAYFCKHKKENILKSVTCLDLKLLYCILARKNQEIKGKKDKLFETIINNIKAKKRGEAFIKFT